MEAALAAREEVGAGSASMAGDDAWEAASAASGLSAVSGLSVYTAAGQSGAPSASAGASAYAPSTVGGRKPVRQRKQKVRRSPVLAAAGTSLQRKHGHIECFIPRNMLRVVSASLLIEGAL